MQEGKDYLSDVLKPLTVRDLKRFLELLPDDMPVEGFDAHSGVVDNLGVHIEEENREAPTLTFSLG